MYLILSNRQSDGDIRQLQITDHGVVQAFTDAFHTMSDLKGSYAKKGEKVVSMNLAAVDAGINSPVKIEVPEVWSQAADDHTVMRICPMW